ncbi:MAG TPA: zinc ribbon domain-containing protein [Pyrinomonadaceae bacterium]
MFCPNCGAKNNVEQNYCRGCGLRLGAIVEAVADQFPSKEFADFQRKKEMFDRIGIFCLSIAGLVGFALLLFKAAQYKAELFGEEILLWSAIGALIGFLLLSVFFFNYTKAFLKRPVMSSSDKNSFSPAVTTKLIEDRPYDYVSSVTDATTDLLKTPVSRREE